MYYCSYDRVYRIDKQVKVLHLQLDLFEMILFIFENLLSVLQCHADIQNLLLN